MQPNFPPTYLTNRNIIQVNGKDAAELLQDLLTCNIEHIEKDELAYGFLLTPQGRFLHELFVLNHAGQLYLDVEADHVQPLLKRLKIYTLKRDVTFELVEDWAILATSELPANVQEVLVTNDPRHTELGYRIYGRKQALQQVAEDATTSIAAYNTHRIALGIPASEDFIPEKTLLLDYDVDQLGGVDFDKGCYVGQEVTARMHYRGVNKKGLYIVTPKEGQPLPHHSTPITHNDKEIGTVLSVAENCGLAILRHEHATGTLLADNNVIHVRRPSWAKHD